MREKMRSREINTRYQNTLNASIALFREGKDHAGLDALLHSLEDLESLLDTYQCTGEACLAIDKILPVYRKLLEYMRNQDITGMTDLLEFKIYPLSMEQIERCDEGCE
jgi:hypothetical protein